jgi:hypothetical protein
MEEDDEKPRISGKTATQVAMDAAKRGPIRIDQVATDVPEPLHGPQIAAGPRKAPPRLRKPSPHNDQCLAPTEGHRARLREAFGNAMSVEFVEVILGKLVEALRPSPFDKLDEPTLNAGLALISSIQMPHGCTPRREVARAMDGVNWSAVRTSSTRLP